MMPDRCPAMHRASPGSSNFNIGLAFIYA